MHGETIKIRMSYFNNNCNSSHFAQRLLEYGRYFGKMDGIRHVAYFSSKGNYMDKIQKFYIGKEISWQSSFIRSALHLQIKYLKY